MTYLQRDNQRRNRKKVALILFLMVIIGGVTFFAYVAPHFFSPVVHAVGVPVAESRSMALQEGGNFLQLLKTKRALIVENRELKEKEALYNAVVTERELLRQQNNELRALFNRAVPTPQEVIATILSKPGLSPYDTLIIDVGEEDGIKEGDLVLVDRSIVIGHIESVLARSAKVISYSSPEYKTDVFIGEKAIQTVAVGKGGGNFEVKLPRNAEVKEGDIVMLSQFPGKIFGTITSIQVSSTDTFEKILFRSVVDINQIRTVTVEKQ